MTRRAVVVGAGISGLATAVALSNDGWDVVVYERAAALEAAGGGIGLTPNGLRALHAIGAGDRVRERAVVQNHGGMRKPDGRWISRTDLDFIEARFGQPVIALHRAELIAALAQGVPADSIRFGVTVRGVSGTVLHTGDGDVTADLLVGADGIRSAVRESLFPDHPGVRYAGYTSWRFVVPGDGLPVVAAETWGAGARFSILPLPGGLVHCSALANAPRRTRHPDERAELIRRFGHWHDPIPRLVDRTEVDGVLHHDIEEHVWPLAKLSRRNTCLVGDAAHAMTPNLGSASLALEDAVVLAHALRGNSFVVQALAAYTAARNRRVRSLANQSRRIGQLGRLTSPAAVALRDLGMKLGNCLPQAAKARALDPVAGWQPPE